MRRKPRPHAIRPHRGHGLGGGFFFDIQNEPLSIVIQKTIVEVDSKKRHKHPFLPFQ